MGKTSREGGDQTPTTDGAQDQGTPADDSGLSDIILNQIAFQTAHDICMTHDLERKSHLIKWALQFGGVFKKMVQDNIQVIVEWQTAQEEKYIRENTQDGA